LRIAKVAPPSRITKVLEFTIKKFVSVLLEVLTYLIFAYSDKLVEFIWIFWKFTVNKSISVLVSAVQSYKILF